MNTKKSFCALFVALSIPLSALAQVGTIYSHSFSGGDTDLNGTAVDVGGENWSAGDLFRANGDVNTLVSGSASGQAAWLPFSPQAGFEYTATATILNPHPDWIAFGFMPELPTHADADLWTDTHFGVRHSNSGAHAWLLNRDNAGANNQEGFNGPNTSNGAFGGNIADATQAVTVSVVLNTMDADWTATYFLNGVQQGGAYTLAGSVNDGTANDIAGIGFSRTNNPEAGTGGTLSDFSLTAIPEPSTYALIFGGVVLAGAMLRRLNRKN